MEKLEHYRSCIQTLLEKHSNYKSLDEDVESELFFDSLRDHYQLMRVGWKGLKRIYYNILHFDKGNLPTPFQVLPLGVAL